MKKEDPLKVLSDLEQDILNAFKYIQSVNGKLTMGDEFVPNKNKLYENKEDAQFAEKNPIVIRAIDHEVFEVQRRID